MGLQFKVDTLDGVDENTAKLYVKDGDSYKLDVDGIDTADEFKSALQKERESSRQAQAKLKELSDQKAESDRLKAEAEEKRLLEKEEFKTLYEKEQKKQSEANEKLLKLQEKVSNSERSTLALETIAGLSKDPVRSKMLKKEALEFIHSTPEGVKIVGPNGDMESKELTAYLIAEYPFLVDGNPSGGGGAGGSKVNGVVKKGNIGGTPKEREDALKAKYPELE